MWNWAITVKDGKGATSTMKGYISDVSTAEEVLDVVGQLGVLVEAATEGRIEKIAFGNTADLPPLNPVNAAPLSQREEKGAFTFRCASGKLTHVSVPTFDHESHMKPNSDDINTALADVAALVAHFTTANNRFTDSNGSPIVTLESAKVDGA